MALLSANNLEKYFGIDDIFSGITFDLHQGERVALVGPNGCGKSTLLDIMVGILEPDGGVVSKARDARLGYLPQNPDFDEQGTLWMAMERVFESLLARQDVLRQLEADMASPDDAVRDAALARYGTELDRFEQDGGFTYETRIGQVLGGLGFAKDEFQMPMAHLSGGQKTRALLARLLLEQPDILLMDEPTNHLDISGIEWLEDQLKNWAGTILVVAHDREFLDTVATRVLEMENGRVTSYRGNYTAYTVQREDLRARQQAAYEAQQRHIANTEDYIRRYMAGQRTSQAQGRLKRLNRLDRIQRPGSHQTKMHVNLQTTLRSGDLVVGLYDLSAGYEDDGVQLVHAKEVEIKRGHCVGFLGPNGSGKTTLLRTILGKLQPLDGKVRIGSAVRIGYFAQIQDYFVPGKSILDTIMDAGVNSIAETRHHLARYAFRGDDVFKDVGVLSGGERARVALALLSLQKANFLLLDEPTNHLDIASQEILQGVIADFNGTILMVSHDRYMVREVATQVWAIDEGELKVFIEGYKAYEQWHQEKRGIGEKADVKRNEEHDRRDVERKARRALQRAHDKRQAHLETLENQIHEHEARMQELTLALDIAGRDQDISRVTKLGAEYRAVEAEINTLLEEWAEIADAAGASVA